MQLEAPNMAIKSKRMTNAKNVNDISQKMCAHVLDVFDVKNSANERGNMCLV
jgi:3-polyprenyl-4-hydroxybenzoate decarboxylase